MGQKHGNVALFVPHAGCPRHCSFCNQHHIAGTARIPTPDEVTAACETAMRTMHVPANEAEIAFFGGSFTAIPRQDMVSLLSAAAPFVKNGSFHGIRLSTRPDAVDEEILSLLTSYGVTAIELGAQSMDDTVLARNRRGHTAADVERASSLIRHAGFSLGLQMMTGLPGDTDAGAKETARRLAALYPDTVRIYPTVVLEHTLLATWYRDGTYTPQTVEQAVALCTELLAFFEKCRIPVIRLGLHADAELTSHFVAGPFHPAFRELCETARYRQRLQAALADVPQGPITVRVHPTCVSKLIGQKRQTVQWMAQQGYGLSVLADPSVTAGELKLGK